MNRVSRHHRAEENVLFGDLRIASLFLVNNVILLASTHHNLQQALGGFAALCKSVWMMVSTSTVEAMVLFWKKVDFPFRVWRVAAPSEEVQISQFYS